jgi:hypothetical protein
MLVRCAAGQLCPKPTSKIPVKADEDCYLYVCACCREGMHGPDCGEEFADSGIPLSRGDSTEKQAILYSTARIQEARIKQAALEKIDAKGKDAMWGDDDANYDLGLERFGVDTAELSTPVPRRQFHAWIEEWEAPLLKKKCPVAEATLLEKYKDLVFFDPDNQINYTVYNKNLEWERGRKGGWCLVAIPSEEGEFEDEPFAIADMVIELIADTPQEEHIQIIRRAPGDASE